MCFFHYNHLIYNQMAICQNRQTHQWPKVDGSLPTAWTVNLLVVFHCLTKCQIRQDAQSCLVTMLYKMLGFAYERKHIHEDNNSKGCNFIPESQWEVNFYGCAMLWKRCFGTHYSDPSTLPLWMIKQSAFFPHDHGKKKQMLL